MRDYYIFRSGRLRRKDKSLMFIYMDDGSKRYKPIPIKDVDTIHIFGEMGINTKLINFLSQRRIALHIFNYYGFYSGNFYPRDYLNAGDIVVRQVSHYLDYEKRLFIAKEMVKGGIYGIINNLKRYLGDCELLGSVINLEDSIDKQGKIPSLMGIEGNIRDLYYKSFNYIIKQDIDFKKRVKHPPDNWINAIISFVNSLVYTEVLRALYRTQLNPTVSYLHEPFYRRYSLSLDIAEIFKPILGDRLIFSLLNNNQLKKSHFDKTLNFSYLKEPGRKIVVTEWDKRLRDTIYHKQLKKKVSYRRLVRLEAYKLIKHLLGEEEYKSLRIWW